MNMPNMCAAIKRLKDSQKHEGSTDNNISEKL